MIDKRKLETILADQREELAARGDEHLCHRREQALIDLDSPQAQVVIGVRRSGKSTLCYQALMAAHKDFAYVDFDDERLSHIEVDDLNDILEVLYKVYGDFHYLFLDEVQDIAGWHLFVNRMLRRHMHVVLTGSNAKLLSSELATHLSGRSKEIHLFPFSFAEYCEMQAVDTRSASTQAIAFRRRAFDTYMAQGGFPEMLQMKDARSYVSGLVNNILKRDIEQRFKIRLKAAFEQLANHLLNNVPCLEVDRELADTFGFKSTHTVENYVNYLCQAFLLVKINRYATKSRLRMTSQKLYAIDVALMNRRENAMAGDNLGWRLESIVLLQLLRRCRLAEQDVYYLAERNSECDFVVCQGARVVQAIQVCYDLSAPKTRRRELAGLEMAWRKTGCTNLWLLTDHERNDINLGQLTVKVRPVYEWTLDDEEP